MEHTEREAERASKKTDRQTDIAEGTLKEEKITQTDRQTDRKLVTVRRAASVT
jgi:hypothetical protein